MISERSKQICLKYRPPRDEPPTGSPLQALAFPFVLPNAASAASITSSSSPLPVISGRVVREYVDPAAPFDAQYQLVLIRPEQPKFRNDILLQFFACVVTGCNVPEVLQAAHIVPYARASADAKGDPNNGILFRSDVHILFDKHLLMVANWQGKWYWWLHDSVVYLRQFHGQLCLDAVVTPARLTYLQAGGHLIYLPE